jgi:hypothetical protein
MGTLFGLKVTTDCVGPEGALGLISSSTHAIKQRAAARIKMMTLIFVFIIVMFWVEKLLSESITQR